MREKKLYRNIELQPQVNIQTVQVSIEKQTIKENKE
jgi:hypothetical protein